ncbi:S1C family serine protease [Piscinibacter sp.]|jgi:S1-C subfamily serine protease|uniref:S1C family serine protease n=1 Tax=Piscinibacter sp. TaxID=1903157 RepID=UPI002F3E2C81
MSMHRIRFVLTLLATVGSAMHAAAMTPAEVYTQVSPSVWRVQTYDLDGLPLAQGSAVVIAADTLVTNCHVLAKAKRVVVRREKLRVEAKLELWDVQRDVCQINAAGLGAPAVALGDASQVVVGQNAFAIGNPRGLELTMSAGLVSSVRRNDNGQIVLIQTSAAISGGSSGGGLFDEQGALIGLTTIGSVAADTQNLNFAVPVEWIKDLPQRHAKLSKPAAPASAATTTVAVAAPAAAATPTADGAFASIDDVDRLPYASDRMRERYRVFLGRPVPRAFAISEGGKWAQAFGVRPKDPSLPASPVERALHECEKTNSGRCFLYAVDTRVVYRP